MPSEPRWTRRLLVAPVRAVTAVPWAAVWLAVALAGAALWVTATRLEFETSRNALMAAHSRSVQVYRQLKSAFPNLDAFIVVVAASHPERGKRFVDALAARLAADERHFGEIVARFDTSSLEGKKLLLLSPEKLGALQQRLEDSQELLADLLERPGLVSLLAGINREISKALVAHLTGGLLGAEGAAGPAAGTQTQNVSFLTALFTEMAQVLAAPASYVYRSPWGRFFLDEDDLWASDGYLTAQGGRLLFVLVEGRPATGFVKHAAPLQALRAHLRAVQQEFPEVEAGVTGGNALAADEMLVSQRDMQLATGLALLGVAVLFILTFREVRRPLLVVATLVVAVAWSLGFTTLTVGHLNILSVAFTPILIGLGIDFGIHLLARYAEERARGVAFAPALEAAYRLTGPGVIMAALTTALAFYAVMLTNFRGLAELGFIAGSGVLLCLLASWTVLPALLALSERQRPGRVGIWQPQPLDPLRPLRRYPRTVLAGLGLVTLAGVVWLPKPQFDYNLLRLQARGTESVVWEHRLLAEAERSSWYAVSRATSLPELYRKQEAFRALPVVERVESLASLLPPDQPQRLQRVAALAPYVEPLHGKWDEAEPVDLEELALLLDKIRFKLQRPPAEWDPRQRPSEAQLRAAREALLAVQDHLQRLPAAQAQAALERLQQLLLADMADKLSLLRRNVHPTPVTLDDIPPLLRQRFVSPEGTYLLRIFARDNIWEREPMAAFVTQLQAVDPEVSGPPVVAYEAIRQMQRGYTRGGLYALAVIVALVAVFFRRPRPALFSLVPLLVGALWTADGMALCGLQFNMANLIILPLFLGIAVDSGIHLVHRAQEAPTAALLGHSTGKAVLLSSLTTMVGFGSLLVARHTGIFSLGLLLTLAVGSSLVAAFVVLPLLLELFPLGPSARPPQRLTPSPAPPGASSTP